MHGLRSRRIDYKKSHAVVDAVGPPVRLMLTAGQVHDNRGPRELLVNLGRRTVVMGDDWIRAQIKAQGAVANIPNKRSRIHRHPFKKALYQERNLIERFFNRIKHCRR